MNDSPSSTRTTTRLSFFIRYFPYDILRGVSFSKLSMETDLSTWIRVSNSDGIRS